MKNPDFPYPVVGFTDQDAPGLPLCIAYMLGDAQEEKLFEQLASIEGENWHPVAGPLFFAVCGLLFSLATSLAGTWFYLFVHLKGVNSFEALVAPLVFILLFFGSIAFFVFTVDIVPVSVRFLKILVYIVFLVFTREGTSSQNFKHIQAFFFAMLVAEDPAVRSWSRVFAKIMFVQTSKVSL